MNRESQNPNDPNPFSQTSEVKHESQRFVPEHYLKKEDVPVPPTATIKSVTQDQIGGDGDKELKPVLSFVGNLKPMVLNKGNTTTLAEHFCDDTSTWPGKTIEVYTDPSVTFQGKRVGGSACGFRQGLHCLLPRPSTE